MEASMLKSQTFDSVTKFILVPNDGIFLEKEHFQDRKGNKFVIEQAIKVKGIITDGRPNLKKNHQPDGLKFDSREYMNADCVYKERRVIFENGFPARNKKIINEILKKGTVYSFEYKQHGWQLLETYSVIPGKFSVQKIQETTLEFYTGEISGGCTALNKEDYERYRKKGIPQSVYDDLVTDNDFSGPILSDHSSLTVNGRECEGFYAHLERIYSVSKELISAPLKQRNKITTRTSKNAESGKNANSRQYLFVHSEWIKRSFYELKIYEAFDINRLRVVVSAERLHPKSNLDYIFCLYYETQENELLEFQFRENFGTNADSVDLYNARGKSVDFDIIDDEAEDEDSE